MQEALTNVAKHACARAVTVQLDIRGKQRCELVLRIKDDGAGFDPLAHRPGHLGLRTMRQRAEQLGGSLTVASSPGEGTTIAAVFPLPAAPSSTAMQRSVTSSGRLR